MNGYEQRSTPGKGLCLGQYLFNLFQNDLICLLEKLCDVFNYTIGAAGKDKEQVCVKLKESSGIMVNWFNDNYMQANPSKFQLIIFGTSLQTGTIKVTDDIVIESRSSVNLLKKLLGTLLDSKLRFSEHVSSLCCKASIG